jgi:outer membrane receptor protein involved in Fe transport
VEWLAAARHSNVEIIADLVDSYDIDPQFLDALGRVQFNVGDRSTIALGYLVLDDDLNAAITTSGERALIGYRDATGYANWRYRPNDIVETRASLAVTERHTDRDGRLEREQNVQGVLDDKRRFDTIAARLEGTVLLSDRWRLESGAELYDYDAQYDFTATAEFNPLFAAALGRPSSLSRDTHLSIDGKAYAAYASLLTAINRNAELDVGLRWDAQRYDVPISDEQFSPRVSLQYHYDPATVLRLSWGGLAQAQRPDELPVQDGGTEFDPAQRSKQTVASIERRVWNGASFRFEA